MKRNNILKKIYNWFRRETSEPEERDEYSSGYWQHQVREKALELYDAQYKKVLEVGCGEGLFLKQLALSGSGLEVWGVDPWADILKRAQKRMQENNVANVKLLQASAYNLPFEDSFFDTVVCINVFYNLPSFDDIKRSLAEFNRVTRPGGRVIFDFRNALNPVIRFKYKWARYYDSTVKDLPLKAYNYWQIIKALEDANFGVLRHAHVDFLLKYFSAVILIEAVNTKEE